MAQSLTFATLGCMWNCVTTPGPRNSQGNRLRPHYRYSGPVRRQHNFALATITVPPALPPGPRFPGGSDSGRPSDDGGGDCGDKESGFSLLALWKAYSHVLQEAPLRTKALTAGILNLIADILAQLIGMDGSLSHWYSFECLDSARFLRFGLFGTLLAGPLGHVWFGILDQFVCVPGPFGIVLKTAVDQLCFCPFILMLFFGVMPLLEGKSLREARTVVSKNLKSTVFTSWKIWPILNFINFGVVPPSQRVLFVNGISVFWVTFLSMISSSKKPI